MKRLYALVGMKHRGTEVEVAALKNGTPLKLVRQPDNPYDPNAVQVWTFSEGETMLGFISGKQVKSLAEHMDARGLAVEYGKLAVDGGHWPMVEVEQ